MTVMTSKSACAKGRRSACAAMLLGMLLFAGAIVLYLPVWSYPMLDFDDVQLVMYNPLVSDGLSWGNLSKHLDISFEGHWIPLTWFSFFLERLLVGVRPGVFHGTNAILHAGSVLLLFLLLHRLTGTLWPGALLAALFAVHPLHVESVAWIAERKDVLSMILGLGALHAYVGWVRRPGSIRYFGMLACLILSLTAKPMFAVFPLLLLLLDYWPLGRFRTVPKTALILEKTPLIAISLVFGALSIAAQRPMFSTLDQVSLASHASYALVAPLYYFWKILWPSGLAVMYSYKSAPYPVWVVVVAPCLAVAATWWVVRLRGRHPWALVGWLWYLVVLAPVSGIAQAGITIVADRLVYVPALGLYLLFAWGGRALVAGRRNRVLVAAVVAGIIVVSLALVGRRQIGFWRDSRSLFERALAISPEHWAPWGFLVTWWLDNGDGERALDAAYKGYRSNPSLGPNAYNLGRVLEIIGRYEEARTYYLRAIELGFERAEVYVGLGTVAGKLGDHEAGLRILLNAYHIDPHVKGGAYHLGVALVRLGRKIEAVEYFREAVTLDPGNFRVVFNLGRALWDTGRVDEAVERLSEVVRLQPDFEVAHGLLGMAREAQGRRIEAAAAFRAALALNPSDVQARDGLARVEGR